MAEGLEATTEFIETGPRSLPHAALPKATQIPENMFVNQADEPMKLQKRVLEWRSGQQNLCPAG